MGVWEQIRGKKGRQDDSESAVDSETENAIKIARKD